MMKVFLSWSGEASRKVAEALYKWLPRTIQAVKPWISTHDMGAGAPWVKELTSALADHKFGIICLTPECLQAPWILFEAGVLWKATELAWICPYLFRASQTDVRPPLSLFQAVLADQDGTWNLMLAINKATENPLRNDLLKECFVEQWPKLESDLRGILVPDIKVPPRDTAQTLQEMLEILRTLQRSSFEVEQKVQKPSYTWTQEDVFAPELTGKSPSVMDVSTPVTGKRHLPRPITRPPAPRSKAGW